MSGVRRPRRRFASLTPGAALAAALVTALVLLSGCAGPTPTGGSSGSSSSSGSSGSLPAAPVVRIASLKGPTTMGLVKLMSDADPRYQVTMHGSPDEIVAPLVKGDVDIALLPANLAAVLYAKSGHGVQVAAINTLGVLSVVAVGDDGGSARSIHSIADLKGRTIYNSGKGTTPEYVLNYLLRRSGLDPTRDVRIEYKSEATEIATLLATAKDAVAVLPQPFVTIAAAANPDLRVVLDLTSEWNAVGGGSSLVTGVTVVRTEYAARNRSAVAGFLSDYRASTAYTNEHPAAASALIARYGIVPSAVLAERAIPGSHITYVDGAPAKTMLSGYLQVLHDANPASVGGSLPDDDFYYRP